jgi:class 3 adenylate cyclase/tetratricopeptide (TPR) repeat protein
MHGTEQTVPLRLGVVRAAGGGLVYLASGRPGLALHDLQPAPPGGLDAWRGAAWQQAADADAFGLALAEALLPPALQAVLARAGGGPLLLLVDASLADLPWELAVVHGQALDDRFLTSRQVLVAADGKAGAANAGPATALQLLDDNTAAAAAGRAGQPAMALPGHALAARSALAQALADGACIARAAQAARQAARRTGETGGDAWLHGDAVFQPAAAVPADKPATAPDDDVRQVSILSVDLVGSTRLMHELGDEEYSERLTHYHQKVAQVARAHAGLADDPQGDDGFMCYFGHPVASEDAAAMAVRAGLTLATAMDDLGLQLRIGISTGRVVIRNGQPVGAAVHHAARLQQAAPAGAVYVGAATRRIAGERFDFELVDAAARFKGFGDAGAVWRAVKERPVLGTERFDSRADLTPFIGRDAELAQVLQHWQAAVTGERQALLLHGEAGIGKSRLVRELRQTLAARGYRTLECRCAPESTSSAFQPLIDLLRRQLRVHEGDPPNLQVARLRALQITTGAEAEQALALLGALLNVPPRVLPPIPGGGSAERRRQLTMDLLARVSTVLADQAPVCLILEDVQWADPSTRALMQRLIDGPRHAPAGPSQGRMPEDEVRRFRSERVLLLLTLRGGPEEAAACGFAVPTLRLGGLGAEAAQDLLRRASGGALDDSALAQWLAARADGVPLFIEESARMAAALAAQRPGDDIARLLRDAVPGTLQDLLTARLDQLPQAKRAAQVGGALGRAFPQALIEAVNDHAASPIHLPALGALLGALVQAGLLTAEQQGGQTVYTFRHALVRDAAHQSLLERDRRRLHGAIAAVLQSHFGALCDSQPELLALHQEQAGQHAEALAGWERAARHAARRSAHHEACAHLKRALTLLARPADGELAADALGQEAQRNATELRLQLLLSGVLIATQGYGADQVGAVYDRALVLAQTVGDHSALHKLRLGLEGYHFMRGDFARAQAIAHDMAARLGADPEPQARLQASWAQANILFHQGQLPEAVALTDRCLADYHQAGTRATTVQDPGVMCLCYSSWALWEMGRADEALARARQGVALAERLKHPFSLGQALGFLAVAHYFRGEHAPGLLAAQRAIAVCEAGGFVQWLAHARVLHGRLRAALGDLEAGLAEMDRGHAQWAATGAVVTRPFYAVLRAEGLALAGRPDEALPLVAEAHALIGRHGERYFEPEVHRVMGQLLLDSGRGVEQALPWLEDALAKAQALQLPGLALRAALALAPVWASAGRRPDALALLGSCLVAVVEGAGTHDLVRGQVMLAALQAG